MDQQTLSDKINVVENMHRFENLHIGSSTSFPKRELYIYDMEHIMF
jgi:hypothetical protein